MGTASFEFLGFSLCVIAIFNLGGAVWWRQSVLLAASLTFLSFFSHDLRAFIPFAAFIAVGYASVRLLLRGAKRAGFIPIVIACIAAFVWLKKYAFVPAALFLHHPYVTVGLSYIFFRLLHLLIDAHAGQIKQRLSFVSYLNYTLNFTTLLSGPIQTYEEFAAYQLAPRPLRLDIQDVGAAIERIIVGFFKVNVLSLLFSAIQSRAIAALPLSDSFGGRVWQAVVIVGSYPLYLYCNFSGYIDMVIGIARFLRLELPENFNRPFASGNFMIFWSRWHITLSRWLRTYVYNPLLIALVRRYQESALAPYLPVPAIFATFFLVGLWHGQTSEFLFFGVLQGGGVAGVQLYQTLMNRWIGKKRYRALAADPWYAGTCRGLTFAWFAFTLLWFWSDWGAIRGIGTTLGLGASGAVALCLIVGAAVVLAAWEAARRFVLGISAKGEGDPLVSSRYVRVVLDTAIAVVAAATVALVNAPAPDLVYKSFNGDAMRSLPPSFLAVWRPSLMSWNGRRRGMRSCSREACDGHVAACDGHEVRQNESWALGREVR